MRRFFAFLFRHDWEYDLQVRTGRSTMDCRLVCKHCGVGSYWHKPFDLATWFVYYGKRGCHGKVSK